MSLPTFSEKSKIQVEGNLMDTEADQNTIAPEPKDVESASTATVTPPAWKGIMLTAVCTLSIILVSATLSGGLISLPQIGVALNIREDQLQWVTSAYALSSGCLLILFGRLADLHGRRKVFILGCIFQGAFALGSGFAKDLVSIGVLRAFQGIGAAATIPASLGILAHAFPPGPSRALAFATFSAGQPLGGGLGFAIGGLLTTYAHTTWQTMFFIVAGLSVLCIAGALVFIDPDHPTTEVDRRVDWLGAFLVTAGLTFIVFILSDGEVAPRQWRTPYIIALLIIGVFFLCLFVAWQWHLERPEVRASYSRWAPPPLMKLSLWKRGNGKFAVMQCIVLCLMSAFQSWMFWTVLYYQSYKQYSPVLTMIRMLPMIPAGITCNIIIGLLIGRIPAVYLIATGCLCTGIAGLLFAVINTSATYWAFGFPAAIISVWGADFVFAAGSLYIAKVSLPHEQSLSGGLFQTMTQLGTSLGLSITTIVFDRVRAQESAKMGVIIDVTGSNAPLPAQLHAYRAAQWTVLGLGAFAAIMAVIFLRGAGIVGGPHKPEETEIQEKEERRSENTEVSNRAL
ncbi:efflux transporter [Abortiporus biennis]|nr:efflux transporter [Abortiporus biennis]